MDDPRDDTPPQEDEPLADDQRTEAVSHDDPTSRSDVTPHDPGDSIDGYRFLERIGSGGMGEVWRAEQLEPMRREVAVKIIKLGMDTREVVARFDLERQVLALMDHPYIAKVLDAGATAQGRPYFTLELVRGLPITQYADERRLRTRERLELVMKVCEGIQHAHQKGVIHRDIKPSNVLVVDVDGVPSPRIIDFGVAKAVAQPITDATMYTMQGDWIGTPEYMSPEQASDVSTDIDTRTDVYSLGILLYELLVGARPFSTRDLKRAGFEEIRRLIREVEPPRPSARLSTLGERTEETARRRRVDSTTLGRQLGGDLDWITLKALEKDRNRRYGSPTELAQDIERHLTNMPVVAGPPGLGYRMEKFVRRHRWPVAGAAVVTVAVLAALVLTSQALVRANAAEAEALRDAEVAKEVADFMVTVFEEANPDVTEGEEASARELLDQGAARVREDVEDPEIQATLLTTIGNSYRSMGRMDEAGELLLEALEIRRSLPGGPTVELADAADAAGRFHYAIDDFETAKALYLEAYDLRLEVLDPDDPDLVNSIFNLGIILYFQGEYEEAMARYRQALEHRQRTLGDDSTAAASSYNGIGLVHLELGRMAEAEASFLRAAENYERADSSRAAQPLSNLADVYRLQGRFDEAYEAYSRVMAINTAVYGEDHHIIAGTLNNMGSLYEAQGDLETAERMWTRGLGILTETLGPMHRRTGYITGNLAGLYRATGRLELAEEYARRSIEIREFSLGPAHFTSGVAHSDLGEVLLARGHLEDAEREYRQGVDVIEAAVGTDSRDLVSPLAGLANVLREQGRDEEAESYYLRALEILETKDSVGSAAWAHAVEGYSQLLRAQGRDDEATALEQR